MRTDARKVQTAFRLDTGLLNRLKRKARIKGVSLNAYVEGVLMKEVPAGLVWPKVSFPMEISPETRALTRNFEAFTEEELQQDERLSYIFSK